MQEGSHHHRIPGPTKFVMVYLMQWVSSYVQEALRAPTVRAPSATRGCCPIDISAILYYTVCTVLYETGICRSRDGATICVQRMTADKSVELTLVGNPESMTESDHFPGTVGYCNKTLRARR